VETSYRAMTARERAELEALVSPGTSVVRALLFLAAVGLVAWLCSGLQRLASGSVTPPLWPIPTAAFAYFLFRRAARWTGGRALREAVRRDLERGEIARHTIRVVEALEAPEIEDEGPVFFVRDASGSVLFFSGQDVARDKGRGFPWRTFEIVQAPESGRLFRLKPLGEPFAEVREREPLTYEEARDLGVLASTFGVIERDLDPLA